MPKLPRGLENIFAYEIDWSVLNTKDIVGRIARPWVTKKVKEYLGVEEPGLINLIVSTLDSGKVTPDKMLEKINAILDDVAE